MKIVFIGVVSVALFLFIGLTSAYPQPLEDDVLPQGVEYRDGAISVTFIQVPVEYAIHAIRARTGLQIDVPLEAKRKLLNLRIRGLSLETAVRSLVSSIGFTSFAFTYDGNGHPRRAIILEASPADDDETSAGGNPASERRPLADGEKDRLYQAVKLWNDLKDEARSRIEDRLRSLPPSDDREELLGEYGRRVLGIKD